MHLPMILTCSRWSTPSTKMRRYRVEVRLQSIDREARHTGWMQTSLQLVHQRIGIFGPPSTQMSGGQGFADRVNCQPQLTSCFAGSHSSIQLVALDQGDDEITKEDLMQPSIVLTHPLQPARKRCIAVFSIPNRQRQIHFFDPEPRVIASN